MMSAAQQVLSENFAVTSSIADDVWHPKSNAKGYEWWYFDALSDDGRDTLVIIFLENFIFSPRYNANAQKENAENKTFPAIAFTYYRDGKPIYRAINEFKPEDFKSETIAPFCQIKDNIFQIEATPYGIRYLLNLSLNLPNDCLLKGSFEWLLVEQDFKPVKETDHSNSHNWNLVSPRCDVTGKFEILTKQNKSFDLRQFRGSGYHDHNYDDRWLPETVDCWQWGRAHFADATAVFYRYKEINQDEATNKLFVVRHGELRERNAEFEELQFSRDIFGIKFPTRLTFTTEDNMRLRVKQTGTIDSSFFYLRFLSEMTLTLRDGKPRKTIGITEQLNPKILKNRWLDWLIDMRIAKNGKGAFLK